MNNISGDDRWLEQLLRKPPIPSDKQFTRRVVKQIHHYRRRRRAILGCTWLIALGGLLASFPSQQAWQWLSVGRQAVIDFSGKIELLVLDRSQFEWYSITQVSPGWILLLGVMALAWMVISATRES